MSLVLYTCVLFIPLMELLNGTQFQNITFLLQLAASVVFASYIISLRSIYDSL